MADNLIPILGKLWNATTAGKIADWEQIDNKPDLSDIIATTGNKIVTVHTLAVNEVLTFEANTLYIIQCYDSSANLQTFTTEGAKSIEGQTGVIVVGEATTNYTDSLCILANKGTISTTAATTTLAKTAVPSSGNYLRYYKVQGTAPGSEVVANPTEQATEELNKLKVGGTIYKVETGIPATYYHSIVIEDANIKPMRFTLTNGRSAAYNSLTQLANHYSGGLWTPAFGLYKTGTTADPIQTIITGAYISASTIHIQGYNNSTLKYSTNEINDLSTVVINDSVKAIIS